MLRLLNLGKNERGVAMIEFAFILPILILLFYGVVELTRNILMHQKLDNATHTVIDIINQNLNLRCEDLSQIAGVVPDIISPYDGSGYGVVVTSVKVPTDSVTPQTWWQESFGNARGGSKISSGGDGDPVTMPDMNLKEREQVIAVEVYLSYKPIINNDVVRDMLGLTEEGVYKRAFMRPRYGTFEFKPDC